MEVTRANFRDLLPELTNVINNANFICLDGEFTGLNSGDDVTAYDTPSQYYHKLRDGAMSFLFFQFGLAAFHYDEAKGKYTHAAYNFYLFPRPHNRNARDIRFMCQSSCIDFLASQGFDFNKVFKEGIPYLSDPDEQDVRDQLEERRKIIANSASNIIPIPNELKSCVENACQQIQQFIESNKNEQEIVLERPSSFARRLVYQEVHQRFSRDQVAVETRNFVLVARRINGSEHRLREEEEKREKEEAEIGDAVGFTHIVRLLSKSGKLIIGHNLLLDLLHIVRQFYVPLPDNYEEFKELLHSLFPKLLDTKYMCSAPPFKDILTTTALVNLLYVLKEPPFTIPDVDCEEGKGYKSIDLKYHEAGFDAYMTGLAFLSLGNFLKKTRLYANKANESIVDSPLLKPYLNRLFLMRIQDTHICLGGPDPSPSRSHVYLITFPKEWRFSEINELFAPYGNIFIGWINDTSAWVALQHREETVNVKRNLLNNVNRTGVTLTCYDDYIKKLETEKGNHVGTGTQPTMATPSQNNIFSSPATTAARKRRSDGTQKISVPSNGNGSKRAKRESLGRRKSSLSGIVVDTIPEEEEQSPSSPGFKGKQQSCAKVCIEELQKDQSSPKKKKLQFEENDTWD